MSLANLIRKRPKGFATAIPAIPATDGRDSGATVARIATIAVAKTRSEKTEADAPAPMTDQERAAVLRWLGSIGETDPGTVAAVLERCSQDAGARAYFVGRAAEAPTLPTCEAFEERAAIMEFDAGLSRADAEQAAALDTGCLTCAHHARPGLSDGYCGGRDDLPRAYGENHPLRKLPGDKGATCKEWKANP